MSEPPPEHEPAEPPDLEAILHASLGIGDGADRAITALAAIHAQWRTAWRETGQFTDEETFELVRILVAASAGGLRSLALSWR